MNDEFSPLELCCLKMLVVRATESEKEYVKEYGVDWGCNIEEYESLLSKINNKLGIREVA